jgi:hypothetical protein
MYWDCKLCGSLEKTKVYMSEPYVNVVLCKECICQLSINPAYLPDTELDREYREIVGKNPTE